MDATLRALIIEDNNDDAELMILALRRGGFDVTWTRIETSSELREALVDGPWDAVLSDYTLPGFRATDALEIVRVSDPDTPFIVVSGTIGEESAAALLRSGASDYVLKHNLIRLAPAIQRELREAENRRDKKRTDLANRVSEIRYRRLFEAAQDGILIVDAVSRLILDINPVLTRLLAYEREELLGKDISELELFKGFSSIKDIFQAIEEQEYIRYDNVPLENKAGKSIEVEFISNIYSAGDTRLIQFNIRDVTSRNRAELALQQSEQQQRKLAGELEIERARLVAAQAVARVGSWETDLSTMAVIWSEETYRIFEVESRHFEPTHEAFLQLVHPEDRAMVHQAFVQSLTESTANSLEHRLITTDGQLKILDERWHVVRDEHGKPCRAVGTCQDITQRKLTEIALMTSAAEFRTLAEAMPQIVWITRPDGWNIYFNPRWLEYTGLTWEEGMGHGWTKPIHPDDQQRSWDAWQHATTTGNTYSLEVRLRRADGVYRWWLVRGVPFRDSSGTILKWFGTSTDIDDLKQSEAGRTELLSRLKLQIERMPLAYLLSGPDLRYTHWNLAAERIFGFTLPEVIGKHPFECIVHSRSHLLVAEIFDRLKAGDMDAHGVSENITKSGQTILCEWYNTPLFTPAGAFQGILSLAHDVTERRQAEEALHLRDRAIQAATQGLMITGPQQFDCPIIYVSPSFERITGYSSAELLGRNCRLLQGADTDPSAIDLFRLAIRNGEPCNVELLNYRKDGTPFWNAVSISPVRNATGELTQFVGVHMDVTHRRELEEQLRQAQKMDAFGQLAGGVAHDFNNLLTIINGYSEILLETIPKADASHDLVAEIYKAGERSAGLTRQLLAFSRRQILTPRVLDLNEVITETDKMLRRLIGEDIQLTTTLTSSLWKVRSDPGQIEQVLLNLAVNARDAMPCGGRLTIETHNTELDEMYVRSHPDAQVGPHVLLSVTDNGVGMSAEVLARIFEPFFTTKQPGKGTGLGLATVHGIVNQSDGHVTADSQVGVGTTFKVFLPRVEDVLKVSNVPLKVSASARGTETILLVEDEDGVRTLAQHALIRCGYHVLVAADGAKAISMAAECKGPIQLLITDVVMPGLSGGSVAEQVKALHPGVHVLFVSGYTDDAIIRHGVLRDEVRFLQKPFSPFTLASKVREILDGRK